eukprot:g30600.t1
MCQCRETFDASGPLLSSASFVSSFAEPEDNLHHGALEVYKLEAAKCPGADEPLCDKVRECVDRAAMRVLGASILAKDSSAAAPKVSSISAANRFSSVLLLAVFGTFASRSFLCPGAQPNSEDRLLRNFPGLVGALVATTLASPALAAEKSLAQKLEVSGIGGKRGKQLNGLWDIDSSRRINDRAVYKKGNEDLYLMFNDCQQFQISTKPSGECNGFALEPLGFDHASNFPSSSLSQAKEAKEQKGGFSLNIGLPGVPKLSQGDLEEDANAFSVEEYLAARAAKTGGGPGFSSSSGAMASFFTMEEDEQKIADSLESKLSGRVTSMKKGR